MDRDVLTVKGALVLQTKLIYSQDKQMLPLKDMLLQDLLTNLSKRIYHKYSSRQKNSRCVCV